LLAVLALLGAAMVAAVYANPTIDRLPSSNRPLLSDEAPAPPQQSPRTQVDPSLTNAPPSSGFTLPPWVTWLLLSLCLATVAAIIVALIWASLRDRLMERKAPLEILDDPEVAAHELRERIRAAVDEGLAELDDADLDPRRAVIACWARLEEAAAIAGTPREPSDAPGDLVARLLGGHAVSADVLAGFAEVYRQARFATHTVDVTMREQARTALRQLRDELAGSGVSL
jgi:hypothetical protein